MDAGAQTQITQVAHFKLIKLKSVVIVAASIVG